MQSSTVVLSRHRVPHTCINSPGDKKHVDPAQAARQSIKFNLIPESGGHPAVEYQMLCAPLRRKLPTPDSMIYPELQDSQTGTSRSRRKKFPA